MENNCATCAQFRCCFEHCCDWDDCACGDCDACGGDAPAAFTPSELAARQSAREEQKAAEEQSAAKEAAAQRQAARDAKAAALAAERAEIEAEVRRRSAAEREAIEARMAARRKSDGDTEARMKAAYESLMDVRASLADSVARLETTVGSLRERREEAAAELADAEEKLAQLGLEADLAAISLVSGPAPAPSGEIHDEPIDETLPPLPGAAALDAAAESLEARGFATLDGFVGDDLAGRLLEQLRALHGEGLVAPGADALRFRPGELGGGKTGTNLRYRAEHVRGDHILWADGSEEGAPPLLAGVLRQMDRVVIERLPQRVPELRRARLKREKAMLACYPGGGAAYARHCDNPHGNGRKLTCILYLNPGWTPDAGGALHVFPAALDGEQVEVEPRLDRLLLFWSDARVPHEVRPAHRTRWAVTVWFFDWVEAQQRSMFDEDSEQGRAERERLEKEVEHFQRLR